MRLHRAAAQLLPLVLLAACWSDNEMAIFEERLNNSFVIDGDTQVGSVCAPGTTELTGSIEVFYANQNLDGLLDLGVDPPENVSVKVDADGAWAVEITDFVECTPQSNIGCEITAALTLTLPVDFGDGTITTKRQVTTFFVENDAKSGYQDLDADGYGTGSPVLLCDTTGLADKAGDCDDQDPTTHTDADELCDGIDNNCDDAIDNGFTFRDYYADSDGDDFGDPAIAQNDCAPPPGYVLDSTDCDDARDDVNPDADEVCSTPAADENCNGLTDNEDPTLTGATTYFLDRDGDSAYSGVAEGQCGTPSFPFQTTAPALADCNDDPADDGARFNFLDEDGDGVTSCDSGDGLEDCNDDPDANGALQSPLLDEVVDALQLDEDCNTAIDCYIDADDDGYGSSTLDADAMAFDALGEGCEATGNGLSSNADDCLDTLDTVYPGAPEIVGNGYDEDCDGDAACYADLDNDGFGLGVIEDARPTDNVTLADCDTPVGLASVGGDCDDNAATGALRFPGNPELPADGIDQDCDTDAADSCYADVDMDGYGTDVVGAPLRENVVLADGTGALCNAPLSGYADNNDDCNDTLATGAGINPGAADLPSDDIDQDCSGTYTCYADADNDTFGNEAGTTTVGIASMCSTPGNFASINATDCDDGNAAIKPGAAETSGNNVDEDCNGDRLCFVDGDVDGVSGAGTGLAASCTLGGFTIVSGGDCDDADGSRFPGNTTGFCTGSDSDCVGGDELVRKTNGTAAIYAGATAAAQLDAALLAAVDGDIFELCDLEVFEGAFTVQDNVTLTGTNAGAVFMQPSAGTSSVLTVNASGTVALTNAVVMGDVGSTAPLGGCLNVVGGDVVLDTVDLDGCFADQGGAVYVAAAGSLVWDDGVCMNSMATTSGGCMWSEGPMTLNGVDLVDNEASLNGGAFVLETATASMTWNAGTCARNLAASGGCFSVGGGTTVTLGDGTGPTDDVLIAGDLVMLQESNVAASGAHGNQAFIAGALTTDSDVTLQTSFGDGLDDYWIGAGGTICWADANVDGISVKTTGGDTASLLGGDVYCNAAVCSNSCL